MSGTDLSAETLAELLVPPISAESAARVSEFLTYFHHQDPECKPRQTFREFVARTSLYKLIERATDIEDITAAHLNYRVLIFCGICTDIGNLTVGSAYFWDRLITALYALDINGGNDGENFQYSVCLVNGFGTLFSWPSRKTLRVLLEEERMGKIVHWLIWYADTIGPGYEDGSGFCPVRILNLVLTDLLLCFKECDDVIHAIASSDVVNKELLFTLDNMKLLVDEEKRKKPSVGRISQRLVMKRYDDRVCNRCGEKEKFKIIKGDTQYYDEEHEGWFEVEELKWTKKLLSCARCKVTFYCSRKCQRKDWKKHKKICKHAFPERAI